MLKIKIIEVTPFAENCRILYDEQNHEALVCDPGDAASLIKSTLDGLGCKLKAILITHGHLDHIGAVADLKELTEAPVIGPAKDDAFLVQGILGQSRMLGLKSCKSFSPRYVSDRDTLQLFSDPKLVIKVIATPGHTPGGVCFYFEQEKILLSGDTVFYGSVGRSDLPGGDEETLIGSVRKVLRLPVDTKICPGHGPDTSVEFERRYNPYAE